MLTAPSARPAGAAGVAATGGAVAVLAGILVGSGLLALAMGRYPGGNVVAPGAAGHSFWFNFICDLTGDVAMNGQSNLRAAATARAGVLTLAGALVAFWLVVPACFSRGRARGHLVRALGLMSVAGVVLIPGATGAMHRVAVLATCLPALAAGVLTIDGLARAARQARNRTLAVLAVLGGVVVALTLVAAVLYARTFIESPRVVPGLVPVGQRLATLSLLVWMGAVAIHVGASRRRNDIRFRGRSASVEDDRDRPPASREAAR